MSTTMAYNIYDLLLPGETSLNRLIGDLLDPNGGHGLKNVPLLLFLQRIGHASSACTKLDARVTVNTRVRLTGDTNDRLVDITVWLKGPPQSVIHIENKPYAGEQYLQLESYALDVLERCPNDGWLVYMPPRPGGPPPNSFNPAKSTKGRLGPRYQELPYDGKGQNYGLIEWLREISQKSPNGQLRVALNDVADYLQRRVLGGRTTTSASSTIRSMAPLVDNFTKLATELYQRSLKGLETYYCNGLKRDTNASASITQVALSGAIGPVTSTGSPLWFFGFRCDNWPTGWAVGLESAGDGWVQYWGGLRAPRGGTASGKVLDPAYRELGRTLEPAVLFAPHFLSRTQMGIAGRYWPAVATFAPEDDVLCQTLRHDQISDLADWFGYMITEVNNAKGKGAIGAIW